MEKMEKMEKMESKTIKLRTHPRNFCEEELIVNLDVFSKEKFLLEDGDIIEISMPEKVEGKDDDIRPLLVLQVPSLSQDIQSKGGPLSISKDLAQTFNLEGLREVRVRKVERDSVGLDLVELRFKDQCLTRSDMWRFSSSLIGKCVYVPKKVEFASIRCQVSGLWSQGEMVQSGAIVDNTRVVYRSLSANFFIFIQISSEMWDFDPSGDFYFDKAEGGFLKDLFQRWKEEKCNHEVTIIFFWRILYTRKEQGYLPSDAAINYDKRSKCYEDFFKVIAQGETQVDWSTHLIDIKKNFAHLRSLLSHMRGQGVQFSPASEGNILEAINLAVNVYENSYRNCNFQLTGQQIVIVTAGVGVFEVERDLTMMTRERIIDTGVGVDLISLSEQPLHAVPLFKFYSSKPLDNQEYYNLPHWINYSFYNPVHPWNKYRYRPMLKLSDHLINPHFPGKERNDWFDKESNGTIYKPHQDISLQTHTHSSLVTLKRLRTLQNKRVDHSEHDAGIFCEGRDPVGGRFLRGRGSKVHSTGKLNISPVWDGAAGERMRGVGKQERSGSGTHQSQVAFKIASSPTDNEDPFEADFLSPSSSSGETSYTSRLPQSLQDAASSVGSHQPRVRGHSETLDPSSYIPANISSHTLCGVIGSAESLPKFSLARSGGGGALQEVGVDKPILVTTKKMKFINPFDPAKVHGELTAFHRRWVHTFPQDKCGLAFQTHHALPGEEGEEELDSISSTILANQSRGSIGSYGRSLSDSRDGGQEFRTLHQVGRRHHQGVSVSSSSYGGVVSPASVVEEGEEMKAGYLDNEKSEKSHSHSHPTRYDVNSGQDVGTPPSSSEKHAKTKSTVLKNPIWKQRSGQSERRMSEIGSKATEDFTSVRRTGVDWKSLTEPACLPVTVDYFPQESKLHLDYFESPSELVVGSYGSDETVTSSKLSPWITDHLKVDTFQAFREMISQRLSQGFQLVFNNQTPPTGSQSRWSTGLSGDGSCQNSISTLHKALTKQKEALSHSNKSGKISITSGSIVVRLSLGKVFQKLELAYPDIYISIYKQKVQYHPKPFSYSYMLSGAESGHTLSSEGAGFVKSDASWKYSRVEDYNWNYLDQHVCGHPDFEVLQESHKYWHCRYLLLPSSPPPSASSSSSSCTEEQITEDNTLISNFVRFMEFLNHVKRNHPIRSGRGTPLSKHSLPSSHVTPGLAIPSRSYSLPQESSSSLLTSPIPIQSLFGTKGPRKLPEIGELTTPTPTPTPTSESREGTEEGHGDTFGSHAPPVARAQDPNEQGDPSSLYSLRPSKKSPRLLRRKKSRDNKVGVASPSHEARELGGKKEKDIDSHSHVAGSYRNKPPSSDESSRSPEIVPDNVSGSSFSVSSFDDSIQLLNATSPPQMILNKMEAPEEGIDFLNQHPGLDEDDCCFVAMEAVTWVYDKIGGVATRRDAVKVLQGLVDEQLILHVSMDLSVPFLDGWLIYCIPSRIKKEKIENKQDKGGMEQSFLLVSPEYEAFSKKWFEVIIEHTSIPSEGSKGSGCGGPVALDLSPSPYGGSYVSSVPYYMGFSNNKHKIPSSMANHYVELNADPQFRSDRPEWCFVHYDYRYHPRRGFQFEMQWMVATITLFNQLIQGWTHKAAMCGFNLVPVPILQSFRNEERNSRPFGSHHYIPLQLPPSFPSLGEALERIMSAIIQKLGFIIDPSSMNDDGLDYNLTFPLSSHFYIHYTGIAFVQPVCADASIRVMDRERRTRTLSQGTTLGRGDFVEGMDQDHVGWTTSGGGGSDMQSKRWDLHREGAELIRSSGGGGRGGVGSTGGGGGDGIMSSDDELWTSGRKNSSLKCGFYWYKNTLLARHKNVPGSLAAEYEASRKRMVSLCSNEDSQLYQLCQVLGLLNEEEEEEK